MEQQVTDSEIRAAIEEKFKALHLLTKWRSERTETARAYIVEVNAEFDEAAIRLQREIDALRAQLTPNPEPTPDVPRAPRAKPRTVSLSGTEDWTAEEREHFVALVTGNR